MIVTAKSGTFVFVGHIGAAAGRRITANAADNHSYSQITVANAVFIVIGVIITADLDKVAVTGHDFDRKTGLQALAVASAVSAGTGIVVVTANLSTGRIAVHVDFAAFINGHLGVIEGPAKVNAG